MDIICEITDKDVLGTDGLSNAEPRYTARDVAALKNIFQSFAMID